MYTEITFSEFCDAFYNMGRTDQFSYEGKQALFDYLDSTESFYILDVVALCCSYSENSLSELCDMYGEFEDLDEAEYYLCSETTVIGRGINDDGEETIVYETF